jgi:hypothetical protein
MPSSLRFSPLVLVVLLGACATSATHAPQVRVLSVEAASAHPTPELEPQTPDQAEPPRIGAPGGSGAGSRRVAPAQRSQSGNETVGALPVGIGGNTGPLG